MPRNKKITGPKRIEFYAAANKMFSDLPQMNAQLEKVGLQKVETLDEAFGKILGLWLNIMDFANGKLKPFKNKYALINYSVRDKANRFYPIKEAKAKGLAQLLVKMSI